ncbi:MAG: Nramp family divalent metal transporter [bacterium]
MQSNLLTNNHSKPLPPPPSLLNTLGPSFILLGLALGSGELILWPYLAANYGLGLLWGGLLGIFFQFVLNTEVMRYSLIWGESVFVGFRKISRYLPAWFVISTFIPWALPGFSSATSQIIGTLIGYKSISVIAILLLLTTGIILSVGKTLYSTMEHIQKSIIMIGLPFIFILTIFLTQRADWAEYVFGLFGRGDGWWFFPQGVSIAAFLGAFAYSGAGGNLNLAQSYYVKEKGLGMGKYSEKITSLFSSGVKSFSIEGEHFSNTISNKKIWKKLWKTVNTEHALIFFLLGFVTISVLVVLAKALVYGQAVQEGISFLYVEASMISKYTIPFFGTSFLLIAALMLFSTQIGVLESSSRIISENVLLMFYKKGKKFNLSLAFYIALWGQILIGIFILLLGFQEPLFLLTLAAVLNAASMMVAFPLIYLLNRRHVLKDYHPSIWRVIIIFTAFIFFAVFLIILMWGALNSFLIK